MYNPENRQQNVTSATYVVHQNDQLGCEVI
jgi:hypothetical protein